LTLLSLEPVDSEVTFEDLVRGIELEEIRIICPLSVEMPMNQLDSLLCSQQKLKAIYCHLRPQPIWTHFMQPMHNCFRTLTKIQLVVMPKLNETGEPSHITLAIFGKCHSLEVLELFSPDDAPKFSALTDGKALPATLKAISFANFRISSKDIEDLLRDKPLLDAFRLRNTGQDEGFGLPVGSLLSLLKEKQVKFLSLTRAINEASLSTPPSELVLDFEIGSLLLGLEDRDVVRLELDSTGSHYQEGMIYLEHSNYPDGETDEDYFGFHFHDFFGDLGVIEEGEEKVEQGEAQGEGEDAGVDVDQPEEEWGPDVGEGTLIPNHFEG